MIRVYVQMRQGLFRYARTGSYRHLAWLITSFLLCVHRLGYPQQLNKTAYVNQASNVAGNDFYEVVIEGTLGRGVGLFAVRTGERHPLTIIRPDTVVKQDLIVGGGKSVPGTSYITIRSYGSNTDYVQSEFPLPAKDGAYRLVWLDSLFVNEDSLVTNYLEPIYDGAAKTGFKIHYSLPGLERGRAIPDTLEITHSVNVHGKIFNDSWVEFSTVLRNTGTLQRPLTMGIRYLWDVAIGGDEGPIFKHFNHSDFQFTESSHSRIDFPYFVLSANDTIKIKRPRQIDSIRTVPPGYNIFGSVLTPASLHRAPFLPVRVQQVSWSRAFFQPFDYTINPQKDVTTAAGDSLASLTGGDNAIQLYWGEAPLKALTFWPGQTVEVSQALFAAPVNFEPTALMDWDPPTCKITAMHNEAPKSIELAVQDNNSGLFSVDFFDQENARIDPLDFDTGTLEPVRIIGRAIDQTKPFSFTVRVQDLCGRSIISYPAFAALKPALRIFEFKLVPHETDRYLYVQNQGLDRIDINLNGLAFTLSAGHEGSTDRNDFLNMPLAGDMTIDIGRHLKASGNTMTISYAGPADSRADLVVSDMPIKENVDAVLNLTPIPQSFTLAQNSPNPFRGATKIRFQVPAATGQTQSVALRVYNVLGQLVRTLMDAKLPADTHVVTWDGRDEAGREVAAGVYLYKLDGGNTQVIKKMVLLR